jgi:hypothetical protein
MMRSSGFEVGSICGIHLWHLGAGERGERDNHLSLGRTRLSRYPITSYRSPKITFVTESEAVGPILVSANLRSLKSCICSVMHHRIPIIVGRDPLDNEQ